MTSSTDASMLTFIPMFNAITRVSPAPTLGLWREIADVRAWRKRQFACGRDHSAVATLHYIRTTYPTLFAPEHKYILHASEQ